VIFSSRIATSKLIGRSPARIRLTVACVTPRASASSSCVVQLCSIHLWSLVFCVEIAIFPATIPRVMQSSRPFVGGPLDTIYTERYCENAWTPDPGTEDKMATPKTLIDELVTLSAETVEHARKTERLARERLARLEAGVR
jgi:hypothetical protein